MPAIVEFPTVVKEALAKFGPLFGNEPERVHFAEYLTGLLVAERKNVSAINRQFAMTTDPSCLNRWLTEVEWDVEKLNQQRLRWLQEDPSTCYSAQGVIALDNVLVDHDGKLIEDAGYFWDHAEERYKIAHDYLIANYVCTSGKHYPLEFRRFIKRDACEQRKIAFRDHNDFFRELVDWLCSRRWHTGCRSSWPKVTGRRMILCATGTAGRFRRRTTPRCYKPCGWRWRMLGSCEKWGQSLSGSCPRRSTSSRWSRHSWAP